MTFEDRRELNHFFKSRMVNAYFRIRAGMGLTALLFPALLVVGGWYLTQTAIQTSMSAYYHTPMRNGFVGGLCALGLFMYLYKGYGWRENIALNTAGVMIVGVAMFPMELPDGAPHAYTNPKWHGICAMTFFACIAYVCIFRSGDTLNYFDPERRHYRIYRWIYKTLGLLMILLPLTVLGLLHLHNNNDEQLVRLGQQLMPNEEHVTWLGKYKILVLECLASVVFAAYWLVKTVELNGTEKNAIKT